MLSQQPAIASLRMSTCPTALAVSQSTRLKLQASIIDTINPRPYQLATAACAHGSFIMYLARWGCVKSLLTSGTSEATIMNSAMIHSTHLICTGYSSRHI